MEILYVIVMTVLMGNEAYEQKSTTPRSTQVNQCGLDKSPIKVVYEGEAKIETYPWLGTLFYTSREKKYSTSVILVAQQIVIGSAMDIDRLPKNDFRSRARVVLGHNCTRPGIRIKDYSYHPHFNKASYSSLALIQLETNFRSNDLHPVCAPPKYLEKPRFYTLVLCDDCKNSKVKIYEMTYVNSNQCKEYYRKAELDVKKIWPTDTICAKARTGKKCIWRNGVMLLLRQKNKWSLIGIGVHGPGCGAPARFLDYAHHKGWVRNNLLRIGRPTVTRYSRNEIILRRTLSNVQRFGPCDPEETKQELFTDRTSVQKYPTTKYQRASYNFTVYANLEYSCVVFRVFHFYQRDVIRDLPYIYLNRWCRASEPICYSFQFLQIDFSVEIWFRESVTYHVAAYGKEVRLVDIKKVTARVNQRKPLVEVVMVEDATEKANTNETLKTT
ncbi:uncharacterized protein LOC116773418 [Danaus plexippus]|uniref:uncharacterized protein LOC116773418 n=1 Tax=Danaus plexippus TaxID=13037 RepID=UPI002AB1AD2A|nr:uncharacterized protein LOC116773418 [Danaus plexippus]